MGLMMKNVNIMELREFTEKSVCLFFFLGGGGGGGRVHEKSFWGDGGHCLKRGIWEVCRFKRRLGKERSCVFEVGGGVETPMHTMSWRSLLIDTNIQSK